MEKGILSPSKIQQEKLETVDSSAGQSRLEERSSSWLSLHHFTGYIAYRFTRPFRPGEMEVFGIRFGLYER